MKPRIEHCNACRSGDKTVECMRDDPYYHGVCPIADQAPELNLSNQFVIHLYFQALGTATSIHTDDRKTVKYIKPSEIESLLRLHDVDEQDRSEYLEQLMFLQDQHNMIRPAKAPPSPGRY